MVLQRSPKTLYTLPCLISIYHGQRFTDQIVYSFFFCSAVARFVAVEFQFSLLSDSSLHDLRIGLDLTSKLQRHTSSSHI